MSDSNFKNRILSFYGMRDTDFPETNSIKGDEKVAIVQDNLNVLTTIKDLLSLLPLGFILAPRSVNSFTEMQTWFKNLNPSQGKVLGAVVSYFDRDSGMYEVVRFIGANFNSSVIEDSTSWEWFTTGSASFKGLYNTESELKLAVKNPKIGDHAFVGTTLGESFLYRCASDGVWTKTNKVFKDLVSKYDVVFATEKGEDVEVYDDYIAQKAYSDIDGNPLHLSYLRKWDLEAIKNKLFDQLKNEIDTYFSGAKAGITLNTEDLRFGIGSRLEFNDRINKESVRYRYVILRKNNITNYDFPNDNFPTIYAIRYNYDLHGATLSIPKNSVLDLTHGGGFYNGTIEFGENCIVRVFDRNQFYNITFTGQEFKTIDASLASKGDPGKTGLSAYEEAKAKGLPNTETFEKWIESFKGKDGKTPKIEIGPNDTWIINDIDTNKRSKGEDGRSIKGDPGITPRLRVQNKHLEVSYDKGNTWEELFNFENLCNPSPNPPNPPTPPSVKTANVYSLSKTSYDEVTNTKLELSTYTGDIYKGDLMLDDSFTYKSTVSPTTSHIIVYGSTESLNNGTSFGAKSSIYKYAYIAVNYKWVDGSNIFTFNKVENRSPDNDWRDSSIEYPTSDIYLSTKSTLDGVDFNTVSSKVSTMKVHKLENEGVIEKTLDAIEFDAKGKEYPLENMAIYEAVYVYRKIQLGENYKLKLENRLSLLTKNVLDNYNINKTEVQKESKTALTLHSTKTSELNFLVLDYSNPDLSSVEIHTDISGGMIIQSAKQFGEEAEEVTSGLGSKTFKLNLNYPVSIILNSNDTKSPRVRFSKAVSGTTNYSRYKKGSNLSKVLFFSSRLIEDNTITILSQDRSSVPNEGTDDDLE